MGRKAQIRNSRKTPTINLYFRTQYRGSPNCKKLAKRIGRVPSVIYKDGLIDMDIDRIMVGGNPGLWLGVHEFKQCYNLEKYDWETQREKYLKMLLPESAYQIKLITESTTIKGRRGVRDMNSCNPVPGDEDYDQFIRRVYQAKERRNELGKGVFIYVIHTKDLRYFSPINFTGSQLVFDSERSKLKWLLEDVAERIQPCFNELLLLLVELYVRYAFDDLEYYLCHARDKKLIKPSTSWDLDMLELFRSDVAKGSEGNKTKHYVCKWDAFCYVMEWILDCIHFDNMLDTQKRWMYDKLVDLVNSGDIVKYMQKMIENKYRYNFNSYTEYMGKKYGMPRAA